MRADQFYERYRRMRMKRAPGRDLMEWAELEPISKAVWARLALMYHSPAQFMPTKAEIAKYTS